MENTEQVKSFEEACEKLGLKSVEELPFADPKNQDQKAVNAAAKIFIIAKALNEGWAPNWSDWDEYKYYPWFDMSPEKREEGEVPAAGSGFSSFVYYFAASGSALGSRLVFKTSELAKYAGTQFLDIYRDLMIIE
jgi:hypothetical protein